MATRTRDVGELRDCLAEGGLVLMPTDTLPGFHARVDALQAVARIRAIKGRDSRSPFLMLADRLETVVFWTKPLTAKQESYLESCWPGPFTCILPAASRVPDEVGPGRSTVAFRVPGNNALRSLLRAVDVPLVSTSVNRSGESALTSMDAAMAAFGDAVDLVADMDWGENGGPSGPSALLDLSAWPPVVRRAGPVEAPSWGNL